jgi:dATP pyrophosphohydrolase
MRSPFQVLVIPYRRTTSGVQFAVLRRSDGDYWQFVAGGGEDDESPLQAARRESREETGIDADEFIQLDSTASVPKIQFSGSDSWPRDLYVIPEHSFAVDATGHEVKLSGEHLEVRWVDYDQAWHMLRWDSNRTAMWELAQRLNNHHRPLIGS